MDGLSSKLLKLAAPAVASSVTKVINLSIKASKFPTLWKLASVCPIFKMGKHEEALNNRPISILYILSTIIERHVHNHLYNFLNVLNLLLLKKVSMYRVSEESLIWFRSYLTDRQQVAKYKQSVSAPQHVMSGVPQGSILVPLLFIIYV